MTQHKKKENIVDLVGSSSEEEESEEEKVTKNLKPICVVGIDLGTCFSSGSIWKEDVEDDTKVGSIIMSDEDNAYFPSIVEYHENENYDEEDDELYNILIADQVNRTRANPNNLLIETKRYIGVPYEDVYNNEDLMNYPFEIREASNGMVEFKIDLICGIVIIIGPIEVAGLLIEYLKKNIEQTYNAPLYNTLWVITVPGYFNTIRKECTLRAAKLAGINAAYITTEPVTAIIAEFWRHLDIYVKRALKYFKDTQQKYYYLTIGVFDQGGGTTDIAIVRVTAILQQNKSIEWSLDVTKNDGLEFTGGADYTNALYKYLFNGFQSKCKDEWKCLTLPSIKKIKKKLHSDAERLKSKFNTVKSVTFYLTINNIEHSIKIKQNKYKEICKKPLEQLSELVTNTIQTANKFIDQVFIIGGCANVIFVKEEIINIFKQYSPKSEMVPINGERTAVVVGATCVGIIKLTQQLDGSSIKFKAATGFSIGISLKNNIFKILIPRDTPLPHVMKHIFYNSHPKLATFRFFEGNNKKSDQNIPLCRTELKLSRKYNIKECEVTVKLHVTDNGIFTGKCFENRHPNKVSATIQSFIGINDEIKKIKDIDEENTFESMSEDDEAEDEDEQNLPENKNMTKKSKKRKRSKDNSKNKKSHKKQRQK